VIGPVVALRIVFWCWVAATLVATLAPLPADAYEIASTAGSDKVVHFVLFGGLGALCYLNRWPRAGWLWAAGTSVAAAALIEVVQLPLAYRSGDVWDLVAGAAGAVAAGAGATVLSSRSTT
jgi:hypothetical protein